jgi:hypothetical protein
MRIEAFSRIMAVAAAAMLAPAASALPIITGLTQTDGDDNANTPAQFTGQTFTHPNLGANFLVPVFGEEVPAYRDRVHQYTAATAEMALPSYLVGGEYIMNRNDNRDNATLTVTVTLSSPATVYVLVDNRLQDGAGGDPPTFDPNMQWLIDDGFLPVTTGLNRTQDTTLPDEVGIDEGADGAGPGQGVNQWFSVYSKEFPAGTVVLRQADNAGRNMYGVVVTRVAGSPENPPTISDIVPANNTLFYSASSPVSFSAATVSPNQIAPANVRLILNGSEVSGQLTVGGTATARTATFSGLTPNNLYNAQIIASDQAGRATTNAFAFDTFVESNGVVIEAEDYNYEGGRFLDGAVVNAFEGLAGTQEVDYHENNRNVLTATYRTADFVGIGAAGDVARPKFAAGGTDYNVNAIYAGDWLNYTRVFPSNTYRIFLRAGGAGQRVQLDRVNGAANTANQSTSTLGTFSVASSGLGYQELTDAFGRPVTVTLSGTNTVRLTALNAAGNLQMNYLLFVPAGGAPSGPYISSISPAPGSSTARPDAALRIALANGSAGVANGSVVLNFNGAVVTPTITPGPEGVVISYDPPGAIPVNAALPVSLQFGSTAGGTISTNWTFSTTGVVTRIPAAFGTATGSGRNSGFRIHIHKASNDAGTGTPPALPNTTARAEQQLAGTLIDPLTGEGYFNEIGDGLTTNAVINFQQAGTAVAFIPGDELFPFIDPGAFTPDPNNIAMEATAYLELAAGTHRFGVASDDGFRLTTGPLLGDTNLVLGSFEGGRGETLPGGATEFDFFVEQAGLYPVRLLYYEGQGGASVEFYSVNLDTFERILINDPANPRSVKAFTSRATQIFVPTVSITAPAAGSVYANVPTNIAFTVNAAVQGGTIAKVEYFSGTNKLGESTTAPFGFTFANAEPGRYTITARATDAAGLSAVSAPVSFTVGTIVAAINFQAATAETPAGYLADIGEIFGDRGNGLSYGWDDDNTVHARDRNSANSPNELYDTFNHMQKIDPLPAARQWEIQVPNGRYKLIGASGDPDNFDSVFDLLVEGQTFIKGTPNTGMRFIEGSVVVNVTDGRLSITNGPTAANNKINFVDIFQMPAQTAQPVINHPTIAGNNITITWTGGGTLQGTSSLEAPVTWTDLGSSGTHTEPATASRRFFRVRQ